jgi:hypothetical protein
MRLYAFKNLESVLRVVYFSCKCACSVLKFTDFEQWQKSSWLDTHDSVKANAQVTTSFDPAGNGVGDREIVRHPHGMNGSWMA